ncbi:YbaB/EbfC family nucleoid-associated protein [Nocardia spumae]|uniref:YbaB/EbfC family nucleoid-associated protein n=1 Tax=Nocardia spumae TaxID=2887190 RepID=UPI001D1394BC|nr:YbaB/EbfC family nucleoid-associated protein [Nocardia spumae]
MEHWEREELRSANSGLRRQVDSLLDAFEQQQPHLGEVCRQLESLRVQASSPDQAVEVTVDGSGVLTDLRLTTSAMRSTPEKLASSIVEAVQAAAQAAQQRAEALTAPIVTELDDMGDLPDVLPEAPSLRDIRAFFANQGRPETGSE